VGLSGSFICNLVKGRYIAIGIAGDTPAKNRSPRVSLVTSEVWLQKSRVAYPPRFSLTDQSSLADEATSPYSRISRLCNGLSKIGCKSRTAIAADSGGSSSSLASTAICYVCELDLTPAATFPETCWGAVYFGSTKNLVPYIRQRASPETAEWPPHSTRMISGSLTC